MEETSLPESSHKSSMVSKGNFLNEAQIVKLIEFLLLKEPDMYVPLKVPDLENPKNCKLAQNSARRRKQQHTLETPSGL